MIFDLALIIPCFNEEKRLSKAFETLEKFFGEQLKNKKVILVFVDDGSSDKTFEILETFQKQTVGRLDVVVVRHEQNRGKGAAILSGAKAVEAAAYGFTDTDLSFGLEEVPEFLEKLSEVEVVVATRQKTEDTGYSSFRRLISRGLLFVSRCLTGIKAKDPQSGFKFFTAKVVHEIFPQIKQERFIFDTECLLRIEMAGYKILEKPLAFSYDQQSSVKVSDGLRYFLDLFVIMDGLPFSFRKFIFQLIGLSLFFSLVMYGWVIWTGHFFSDDFTWLWFGQRVLSDPWQIIALKAGSFFSPVMNIFYAAMLVIFGPTASAFFTANILIHTAVATVVGWLVFSFSSSRLSGFLAMLLMALSGVTYEPIVWIGANMHSLATLFILLSLSFYLGFLKTNRWFLVFVSLSFQFLSYATKEISVVLLVLLVATLLSWKIGGQAVPRRLSHWFFWFGSVLLAGAYAVGQIILQEGGETFVKNNYHLGLNGLARLPLAFVDLFVPLKPFQNFLSPVAAIIISVFIVAVLVFVIKRYWKLPSLSLALSLAFFSLLPTTFFVTSNWWEPLASRYTYLPRVGAVMFLAVILIHYFTKNQTRRIAGWTAFLISLLSIFQVLFMFKTVSLDYRYVYQSGRSLAEAARLLNSPLIEKVYIHPEHPFRDNQTHIVAAMSVYAGLTEEQIIFLKETERVTLDSDNMLLYWYPQATQYELTSREEIFERFPLP